MFGHSVRGPLKLLSEQLLEREVALVPVTEYVDTLRKRLNRACELARSNLTDSQTVMKKNYDRKSVVRSFAPGESVLALLPVPGSSLQSRFTGPYIIEKKVNETNYVLRTPNRRRKTRMCHINMLKPYYARDQPEESVRSVSLVAPVLWNNEDEVVGNIPALGESLQNSNVLNNLQTFLGHLSDYQRESIIKLINNFPSIFSDVPSRTNVLFHDIDVGDAAPVKQHPYRVNPLKRGIMKTEVEYMLRNGLAEPSQSAWSSPCLLVPKADSSF